MERPRSGARSAVDTDHLQGELARVSVRGGAVTLAAQGGKLVLAIGSTMVLARLLTPEDFGLVGMVTAVTGFIALFKDLGLSQATVQRQQITLDQVSALFWINVVVSAVLALITVAVAPLIAAFYEEPLLTPITIGLAVGFLFGGATVQHQALLTRQMRFTALMAVELGGQLAGILSAVTIALLGGGLWALVAMPVVTAATNCIGVWIACRWTPGRFRRSAGVGDLLGFGGNLTGFSVVNYFSRNLDNVLIGRVWGAAQLGLYTRAYQLLLAPIKQINQPVARVALPLLSRLADQPEAYRRAYLRVLDKIMMVTLPGVALLIVASDWMIYLLLGPRWVEASGIFAMLGIAALVQPLSNSTGWLFVSQDRTRDMLRWGIMGSALTVGSFFVGLPWGAIGVASAYAAVVVLVQTPLLLWYVGRRGPVGTGDLYRLFWPAMPCALAVAAGLLILRSLVAFESPVAGAAASVGLAAVIATVTYLSIPSGRRELLDMRALVALARGKPLPA